MPWIECGHAHKCEEDCFGNLSEIKLSHRNLSDLCDGILDVTYHNRRVKDTCISDIITWLLELKKIDKVPYFVVDYNGIASLPTFNIEDVTNVALCERLGRLEAHIFMLHQSVAQHTVQLTDMKQHGPASGCYDAQSNRAASPKASTQGSSTSKCIILVPSVDVPGNIRNNLPNVQTDMYAPDTSSNIDNVRTVVKSDSHSLEVPQVADLPRSPPIDNSVVKNKVISDAPCVLPTTSKKTMGDVICQDKEKNWSVVQKKKNVQIGKKMPTVIYGKATTTVITAAFRKNTHIYLVSVDNDVSNGDIIDYLTGAGIKVLKVVRLSSVNAPNRSFKLSVSPADYEKVFDEELWEQGTRVLEWGAHGRPY